MSNKKVGLVKIVIASAMSSFFLPPVFADQVIQDDLISVGSLCVGNDCNNGEAFGFNTLRLKENNTRIRFYDTSSSASFPSNDWQLTANDSSNGGQNKFSIDDIDSGRTPFTILSAAPNNSFFVNSSGFVGLGTATPAMDLHMVSGNSPTIRLDQNGSGGWAAQQWDIGGNEANFFIRDVIANKLPFKIEPKAPTNALFINASGNIGIGTKTIDSNAQIQASSGAYLSNDGAWIIPSRDELIENKTTITFASLAEAKSKLNELTPIKFNYKSGTGETYAGFESSSLPDEAAMTGNKGATAMDVVALLTAIVKTQQETIDDQQTKIDDLVTRVTALEAK